MAEKQKTIQDLLTDYLKSHPWTIFALAVCGTIGGWIVGLDTWADAGSTHALGGLLLSLGSVGTAGLGTSILSKINLQ